MDLSGNYNNLLSKLKNNKGITIISVFFLLLYSSISLVNHYNFRTYALDLGVYINTVYEYAHFHIANNQVWQAQPVNILSDHFDLFLILISPLSYIFGSYTLLLVQLFFIGLGGLGIYKFTYTLLNNKNYSLIIAVCFYSFFGIFSAVAFDYHSNVIAAMIVPWFFLYFFRSKWINSCICFILILITKENMALWLAFISLGLIIHFRNDKTKRFWAAIFFLISFFYFIILIKFIMPALYNQAIYSHMHYHLLGSNLNEVLENLISRPVYSFKLLFSNTSGDVNQDWVKAELHLFILISGGFLLLLKPQFIVMLMPIYFQKLFHDNTNVWGIANQYSVEFAPIIFLGSVCIIMEQGSETIKKIMIYILLVSTLSITIRSFDNTYSYFDRRKQRFYQDTHWTSDFDQKQTYEAMQLIPKDASVSAQSMFVPHLAEREHIYQFPIIKDAQYLILSISSNTYPLSKSKYDQQLIEIIGSDNWEVLYKNSPVLILKRTNIK